MDRDEIIADIERRARTIGVSMTTLCKRADVHPSTFFRWKKTQRNPAPGGGTFTTIEKLHKALAQLEAADRKARRKPVAA